MGMGLGIGVGIGMRGGSSAPPALQVLAPVILNGNQLTVTWNRVATRVGDITEVFGVYSESLNLFGSTLDSGDGTSTWTVTLSGTAPAGTVFTFATDAGLAQDDDGNPSIAQSGVAVTNNTPGLVSGYVANSTHISLTFFSDVSGFFDSGFTFTVSQNGSPTPAALAGFSGDGTPTMLLELDTAISVGVPTTITFNNLCFITYPVGDPVPGVTDFTITNV